jgi:hypothetical protein
MNASFSFPRRPFDAGLSKFFQTPDLPQSSAHLQRPTY